MKNVAQMIVLAVILAVSTVRAQDTLKIESLRTVDVCSDSRRWLLAASIGSIRFADSLESFDITIGYDREVLRPTDVLKEGTLSGQMSNGPTMNLIVPGEVRIFGFNVARSVAGNIPLVAVSGDFVGSCEANGGLTVPYPPDFNSEFKRKYTVNVVDQVKAVAVAKVENLYGCTYDRDTLFLTSNEETNTVQVSAGISAKSGTERVVELRSASAVDPLMLEVVSSTVNEPHRIDSMVATERGVSLFVTSGPGKEKVPMVISSTIRRSKKDYEGVQKIEAALRETDNCVCVKPGLKDTLVVKISPVVSVRSSVDDPTCTVNVTSDRITGKCDHQKMKSLDVFDLYGRNILMAAEFERPEVEVSTADLPSGFYLVRLSCGKSQTTKSIVK